MKRDRNRAGSPESKRMRLPVQNGLESRSHVVRDRNESEAEHSHRQLRHWEGETEHPGSHRHNRHGEEQIPSVFER